MCSTYIDFKLCNWKSLASLTCTQTPCTQASVFKPFIANCFLCSALKSLYSSQAAVLNSMLLVKPLHSRPLYSCACTLQLALK